MALEDLRLDTGVFATICLSRPSGCLHGDHEETAGRKEHLRGPLARRVNSLVAHESGGAGSITIWYSFIMTAWPRPISCAWV